MRSRPRKHGPSVAVLESRVPWMFQVSSSRGTPERHRGRISRFCFCFFYELDADVVVRLRSAGSGGPLKSAAHRLPTARCEEPCTKIMASRDKRSGGAVVVCPARSTHTRSLCVQHLPLRPPHCKYCTISDKRTHNAHTSSLLLVRLCPSNSRS